MSKLSGNTLDICNQSSIQNICSRRGTPLRVVAIKFTTKIKLQSEIKRTLL